MREDAKLVDVHAKEFVNDIVVKAKDELDANKIKITELIARAEKGRRNSNFN